MPRPTSVTLLAALLAAPAPAATPFISELYFDPPGSSGDRLQEYLEISGASGQTLDGLYLLQIENENNAFGTGTQGRVDLGFDLGAQQLGANGRLVIASANGGLATTGRPAHAFDPASTLVQGTADFFGYRGVSGLLTDLPATTSVNTENSGGTFLLIDIGSGAAPAIDQDFDVDDDGTLDLPAGYTVLDAVGLTSEPGEQNFGGLYGATNFVVGTPGPDFDVNSATLTVVDFESEYLAREANSNRWFVANLTNGPAGPGPDVPVVGARYVISAADVDGGTQNGVPEVSINLPYGLSPLTPGGRVDVVQGLRGDYNQSGGLDASDIDTLFAARGALSAANAGFDLTPAAGVVNRDDARVWVEHLAGTRFGDFNLDGNVSNADVAILRPNLGAGGGWASGDATGDGLVTNADVLDLRTNLGFTAGAAVASVVADLEVAGDGIPDVAYDPATGELRFVDDGAGTIALTFNTAEAGLKPSATSEDRIGASWIYNAFLGQSFFEFTDTSFGFFPATGADLVLAILPGGLSAADFGRVEYQVASDTTGRSTAVTVVPEPTALALLALGGLACLGRRRGSAR